jgi:hypothetical protein
MALTGRKAMSALMPAIGGKANDICSCRAFQLFTLSGHTRKRLHQPLQKADPAALDVSFQ